MGATPAERSRQLAQINTRAVLTQHAANDMAHMPGRGATTMARATYWENQAEAAMERWETADREYRTARATAGHDLAAQGEVLRLETERERLYERVRHCNRLRDDATAELDAVNRPLPPDIAW